MLRAAQLSCLLKPAPAKNIPSIARPPVRLFAAVDGLLRAMTFQLQPDADQIALLNLRLTTSRDASGKKNASRPNLILQ
jgi:hypothetical protein